jgi:hypothetical protein
MSSEKINEENALMSRDNDDSPGVQQLVVLQVWSQKDISTLNSMIPSLTPSQHSMVSEVTNDNEFKPNNQNISSTSKFERPNYHEY